MTNVDGWLLKVRDVVRFSNEVGGDAHGAKTIEKQVLEVAQSFKLELENDMGLPAQDAMMQVQSVVGIAMRKELTGYALKNVGLLIDACLELLNSKDGDVEAVVDPQLPLLMFEDLFHAHICNDFKTIWDMLLLRSELLTAPSVFEKTIYPKLVLMRIGNYILHRLSSTSETELCGRVQMFLAATMPLTDKSGVNLFGEYNDQNITDFDDESEFLDAQECKGKDVNKIESSFSVDIEETDTSGPAINYSLYFKFWQLQAFFAARPHQSPSGCASTVSNWTTFSKTADLVLSSFESLSFLNSGSEEKKGVIQFKGKTNESNNKVNTPSKADKVLMDKPPKKKMKVDSEPVSAQSSLSSAGLFPLKYVTSSRLFKLQLSDPTIRRNVLVQFAFLFCALKRYLDGKEPREISESVVASISSDSTFGITSLQARVDALLRATPPSGEQFTEGLYRILWRDDNWHKWKVIEKCKNFVRDAGEESLSDSESMTSGDVDDPEKETKKLLKAKREAHGAREVHLQRNSKLSRMLWRWQELDNWRENLLISGETLKPNFDSFIEPMKVAVDPENGIEDEYHPRNDPVYCWRGLRLLSNARLDSIISAADGSLENLTKKLYPIDVPEATPLPAEVSEG